MPVDTTKLLSMPFVTATLDPTIIRGVYNTCDQWCMYCPVTERCLAYRCRPPEDDGPGGSGIYLNIAARMRESIHVLRELNAAEGRMLPELEALLNDNTDLQAEHFPVGDPLNEMARRYAITSSRYLMSHPDFPFEMRRRPAGPTAFEVFAWYHVLIAAKVFRAIVSRSGAARGEAFLEQDAIFSARTALIGIERSRQALRELQRDDADPRLEQMDAQLRRLMKEVEARFPDARGVVRPGLDAPAPIGRTAES